MAALFNLLLFLLLLNALPVAPAALIAFYGAAAFNYWLCVHLLFQQYVKWKSWTEQGVYLVAVTTIAAIDAAVTFLLINTGLSPAASKLTATALGLLLNFLARRYLVFPEPPAGPWR